ncbi:DUF6356 family protein [Glycocaulis abyssi]|uniref:DUF6356 family protein n=1 Tax=Glycocaulis abyssi TaxID=1433403 RepID=A0ABV9ND68_9PROT
MARNPFTSHPAEGGETYFQHFKFASAVGVQLLLAGLAALVHGVLPFVFRTTASRLLTGVHRRVEAKRAAMPDSPAV